MARDKRPDRPFRVLLANPWSTCHGGTSMVLLEFATQLDRERYEPIVLCPEPGALPDRLRELGIPHLVHSMTGLTKERPLRFIADTLWYCRYLRRERIDLVHLNGPKWRSSVASAAHLTQVPLVVHVHNPLKHGHRNFSLRYAERILPVSNAVGATLYNDPSYRAKTQTLYNGVELERFATEGDDHRAELKAEDRPVIGFVGQLVPRKGLTTLINAMPKVIQRHPQALLAVVGCAPPGDDRYEQECRSLVEQHRLEQHAKFMGFRRDVERWMRTFDLFVLPTRSEPFGKVIIEAMVSGCAVVASRVGGIPEIIGTPSVGTLIPPDDPEAVAAAITAYLDDPERRHITAQAGNQHARSHFSMEAMISQLESIYAELLGVSSAQPVSTAR